MVGEERRGEDRRGHGWMRIKVSMSGYVHVYVYVYGYWHGRN